MQRKNLVFPQAANEEAPSPGSSKIKGWHSLSLELCILPSLRVTTGMNSTVSTAGLSYCLKKKLKTGRRDVGDPRTAAL